MNSHFSSPQKMSPDKMVFAFDLHGVILWPQFGKIFKILIMELFSKNFFSTMKLLFYFPFWHEFFTKHAVSEKKVIYLTKITNFSKEFFIQLINQQEFNISLLQLIQKIKTQGYLIIATSNIWPDLLKDLKCKFPELDELFVYYYIPQMVNNIEKPDMRYYQQLIKFVHSKKDTVHTILFIDDLGKNIEEARKIALFIPILYRNLNSLKETLGSLGINT